jgi:hypothetical protein
MRGKRAQTLAAELSGERNDGGSANAPGWSAFRSADRLDLSRRTAGLNSQSKPDQPADLAQLNGDDPRYQRRCEHMESECCLATSVQLITQLPRTRTIRRPSLFLYDLSSFFSLCLNPWICRLAW